MALRAKRNCRRFSVASVALISAVFVRNLCSAARAQVLRRSPDCPDDQRTLKPIRKPKLPQHSLRKTPSGRPAPVGIPQITCADHLNHYRKRAMRTRIALKP
jgi:hypothetical protein